MSKYKKRKRFRGLNKKARYQTGMRMKDLYPQPDKSLCACGCGRRLTGRQRRWASSKCNEQALERFFVVKGDQKVIRNLVYKRDKGKCARCTNITKQWEAHHVKAVKDGGGACELDNFITLCLDCHKDEHK